MSEEKRGGMDWGVVSKDLAGSENWVGSTYED